jgi:hypothetical protein
MGVWVEVGVEVEVAVRVGEAVEFSEIVYIADGKFKELAIFVAEFGDDNIFEVFDKSVETGGFGELEAKPFE